MRSFVGVSFLFFLFLVGLLAFPANTAGQTAADSTAITQAALDYIQGYYSGNPERMERALHPDLAKRIVNTNPNNGRSSLGQVTILDIFENVASVRVDAATWIDYLHIAKWNGEWKIVNVLWEVRPRG